MKRLAQLIRGLFNPPVEEWSIDIEQGQAIARMPPYHPLARGWASRRPDMDLWTAIETNYRPGADETARSLVEACYATGVRVAHDLADPGKISRAKLLASGATPKAADLAMALVLLKGSPYLHLAP